MRVWVAVIDEPDEEETWGPVAVADSEELARRLGAEWIDQANLPFRDLEVGVHPFELQTEQEAGD